MSNKEISKLHKCLKKLEDFDIITQKTRTGIYCILQKKDIKINLYYNLNYKYNKDIQTWCTVFKSGKLHIRFEGVIEDCIRIIKTL